MKSTSPSARKRPPQPQPLHAPATLIAALLAFDPLSASAADPLAASIRVSEVEVCWNSEPNHAYRIEGAPSLEGPWTIVRTEVPSTGTQTCIKDPLPTDASRRFYRVADIALELPGPLPLQPSSSGWALDAGESSGGACTPLNPGQVFFDDVTVPDGNGVRLATESTTLFCCSCLRRSKSFRLTRLHDSDEFQLEGWFEATRGGADIFSVATFQVDLWSLGQRVALRTFAAENRGNNNCASGVNQVPEALLTNGARFAIPLSSLAGSVIFDEIRIHVQGYGCGFAFNGITLADLQVTLFSPAQ